MKSGTPDQETITAPSALLSEAECELLIEQCTPLVRMIAHSLVRKMPSSVDVDDLMQDGFVGLMLAILQATTEQIGKSYNAYLAVRIRGAMLDGLRSTDTGTPKVRQKMRNVEIAINQFCQRNGRMPSEREVAEALDIGIGDYQRLLQKVSGYTLFSLSDFDEEKEGRNFITACASADLNPLAALERKSVQQALLLAISNLPAREAEILKLRYDEELSMQKISVKMGISPGRASQLHAQAIARLRAAVLGDGSKPSLVTPRWREATV
jgi:RNA polymerase sigma factor for flagellar operon FliA